MRIIKNILFTFLALCLIAGMGVFILFQTFDADQYLPRITKKASLALGRPVYIEHVGLGLSSRGITLDAWPLTIADDVAFTTQPFIKIDRVRISLDLKSLVLRQQIHIRGILLQSPQIHFIRSREGNFNARSIGQSSLFTGDKSAIFPSPSLALSNPSQSVVTNSSLSAIANSSLGVIANPSLSVIASKAKQSLKNGIVSSLRNASRQDVIKSITIQDAAISYIDQNQALPLDIWLTNINASLNDFSLTKPFRFLFDASLYNNEPNVHANALVCLDLSKRSVLISNLSLHTDLSQLNIEQLKYISPDMPDSIVKAITGVIQLNMSQLEVGVSSSFEAKGDISITNGVIKNFNIIKTILSHALAGFGGISIDTFFKGPLKEKLGADDTIVEKAEAGFSFHDKTFFIDNSLIKTDIFELTAKGSVDQGLNTDMQTMLHFNPDISAALINDHEGLKFLSDDSQRIAIGASLKGVIPHLKYKPDKDFRKKSKKVFIAEGGNILDAIFGGGQSSSRDQDSNKKPKNSVKNILKSLLQ